MQAYLEALITDNLAMASILQRNAVLSFRVKTALQRHLRQELRLRCPLSDIDVGRGVRGLRSPEQQLGLRKFLLAVLGARCAVAAGCCRLLAAACCVAWHAGRFVGGIPSLLLPARRCLLSRSPR